MFRSLRSRLLLSFFVIVVVTLTAAALALFARLGGYQDDLTESTLRSVSAPIYYNLTLFNPVLDGRAGGTRRLRADLENYLRLQREAGITVLLVDANGRVIPDSGVDPELLDERFPVPVVAQRGPDFGELQLRGHTTSEGDRLVFVSVPTTRAVRQQEAGVYSIVVALPESSRRDVWRDLSPRLLFAGTAGMIAATGAMLLLWLWLFRPLGKVTRGIRAVAAGQYDERVPVAGPTEVRALASDVNRMADSVEESRRVLREFLANVGHELKTPLTSIRGFAQAMIDGTLETPEERARAARVIDAESRRVLHLVGELLDLSRIESGQQRMALAPVNVGELLAHVRDVFALRAADAGVALNIPPSGALAVTADFDRIEQVLGNLLDNAFRHAPRGGSIEAGARESGAAIELYVADDGPGIPDDELPHVFDRFYRGGLDEPQSPGAGLGLAICREIVRAHGGTMRAANRPGGGTEFAFTLPRAAPAAVPADATGPTVDPRPRFDSPS
jgi:signal transduction histidine kinase